MTLTFVDRVRSLFGRAHPETLASSVAAARAVELVRDGAQLLDVREDHEWKAGRAPQAVHVPLGRLDTAHRRLSSDRPVLVVWASGMRSRTAAKRLRAAGYDAASVSGGMAAWQRSGGVVRR